MKLVEWLLFIALICYWNSVKNFGFDIFLVYQVKSKPELLVPRPCSLRWKAKLKSTVRWFVVREKYCTMTDNFKRTRPKFQVLLFRIQNWIAIFNTWISNYPIQNYWITGMLTRLQHIRSVAVSVVVLGPKERSISEKQRKRTPPAQALPRPRRRLNFE